MSIKILLITQNARYEHAALGIRYLHANLGECQKNAKIIEFVQGAEPRDILERILNENPDILGVSVHIWNIQVLSQVVECLKKINPNITVIAGGPEISYEFENSTLYENADYLISGEGETVFREICNAIRQNQPPNHKVYYAPQENLENLTLPYGLYTEKDARERILYFETSRGCPFRCSFCLSALSGKVRLFPMDPLRCELKRLLDLGAKRIKFVDRTFNITPKHALTILEFLKLHQTEDLQVHFEIIPDRLEQEMIEAIAQFPAGRIRLEAGLQSLNENVLKIIQRTQDQHKSLNAIKILRQSTGAILHVDLVAGLPGETMQSFAEGFDQLLTTSPQEIQIGILKRLHGAPITKLSSEYGMQYCSTPPYEVIATSTWSFQDLQRIKRFARYFELYHNHGNFATSLSYLWKTEASPFHAFIQFSDWLWEKTAKTHSFALADLARKLYEYLKEKDLINNLDQVANAIEFDFRRLPGRKDKLNFLQET